MARVCVNQDGYREKRCQYLSRSESLLFDLYDETVDDDDFALFIDRVSTPVDRHSAEPGSLSASRCSSVTGSGHLQPPDAADTMQRSSSEKQQRGAAGKSSVDTVMVEGASGRLPRPRSAIITRESAVITSTTSPLVQTACDDVVTTTPANLLSVPSSWYRTEVATNVGPGSRRLTANVQLGLPPPAATASITTSTDEVTAFRKTLILLKKLAFGTRKLAHRR